MADERTNRESPAPEADPLIDRLRSLGSVVVALSGGVDSAVVAKAAQVALGERSLAATGVGPALAEGELDEARAVAAQIGIEHVAVETDEIRREAYAANAPDRCFHCKTELYTLLRRVAEERGFAHVVGGANADDVGDHRPGMRAAADHAVVHPLLELGLGKDAVRRFAKAWGLPIWDKPATPCLASRVAYGERVTPERLARIDAAERWIRSLGLREVRVRHHPDDLARIEAPLDQLPRLLEEPTRRALLDTLRGLGFKAVTVDLAGFRSGSMNEFVSVEALTKAR